MKEKAENCLNVCTLPERQCICERATNNKKGLKQKKKNSKRKKCVAEEILCKTIDSFYFIVSTFLLIKFLRVAYESSTEDSILVSLLYLCRFNCMHSRSSVKEIQSIQMNEGDYFPATTTLYQIP